MRNLTRKSMALGMAAMTLLSAGAVGATDITVEGDVASVAQVVTSNVGKNAAGDTIIIGAGDQDSGVAGHSDFNANTTVTGTIDPITTLDVTVPVGGINFAIDSAAQITSQGIVVESNTPVPLQVNLMKAEAMAKNDQTNGLAATNLQAPALVEVDTYTADEWNNLKRAQTMAEIAIALKQVDVEGSEGAYTAGEALTDATADADKITSYVELAAIDETNGTELFHIESGFSEDVENDPNTARAAVNLELSKEATNYGKAWVDQDGSGVITFRYNTILEFVIE